MLTAQAIADFTDGESHLAKKWIALEQKRAALAKEFGALAVEEEKVANKRAALEKRRFALAQEMDTLALEEAQHAMRHASVKSQGAIVDQGRSEQAAELLMTAAGSEEVE